MDSVENQLELLLKGGGIEMQEYDSPLLEEVVPVTVRKTVCYIVAAVILNEQKEVVMMQEAKQECYGKWYLPAGRMEQNETIVQAVKREVQEETGLECEPYTLLSVEERGPRWIRFVFLARVTGGNLKSTSESDAESLQAKWWDRVSPLPLRARDILNLISFAVKHKEKASHPVIVPVELPCSIVCHRVVAAFLNTNNDLWLLTNHKHFPHFPVTACGSSSADLSCSVEAAIYRLIKECSMGCQLKVKTHGILGLQHSGSVPGKADGVCFNVLVTLAQTESKYCQIPPDVNNMKYGWHKVDNDDLKVQLLERLSFSSVVPFLN
ncbi:8-oxo-dGDP phosphatase NUDT18 [Carcharodon carcharias]|uniref:8-oxo-dGDP phosphatase NUDT18 n=1 Tax=Carcharodon carcharias TaxID=13397 RepID=UPI001B7DDF9E|nr:8-oxo-dGDP phosphatase NUDT18 [Carcharodon carcharias]XP_041065094.1 8-oxo-dGDP phosphatase NUDT18 [Carcharodon carcharias]XP_041065095.1 8-oxo-dGDP phosphatase NUDT18 [Carcharodon carcharias]XP_041065096.1 8-oxo-dGDP phosphatase NUDT18 [Carcharodon carcharias]